MVATSRVAYRFPETFFWGVWSVPAWKEEARASGATVSEALPAGRPRMWLAALSWNRWQPKPGTLDTLVVARCREGLARRREQGWRIALVLEDGHPPPEWVPRAAFAPAFQEYAMRVVEALGDQVDGWLLAWESNRATPQVWPRRIEALRSAAPIFRRRTRAWLGLRLTAPVALTPLRPAWPPDRWAARRLRSRFFHRVQRALSGALGPWVDVVVLRLEPRWRVRWPGEPLPAAWEPLPPHGHAREGPLFRLLRWARRLRRPLWIMAPRLPDAQSDRARHLLVDHLLQIWHGLNLGTVVQGFLYPDRAPDSVANLYRDVARDNGLTHATVARHLPQRLPFLYTGLGEGPLAHVLGIPK